MKFILQDGKLEEQKVNAPETKKEAIILTETTIDLERYLKNRKQKPIRKLLTDLWELNWIKAVAKIAFLAILVWLLFFGLYGVVNMTTSNVEGITIANQQMVKIESCNQESNLYVVQFSSDNSQEKHTLKLSKGVNKLEYGCMFYLDGVYPSASEYDYITFQKKGKSLLFGLLDTIEVRLYLAL